MRASIKQTISRLSVIALLIGSLASGVAHADGRHEGWIDVLSYPWGISPGQTARASVANFCFADGSVRFLKARIQLLDSEGEVVAQSDEIRVAPGKIRFWDAPFEYIPGAGEPGTGRRQLRARIQFEEGGFDPGRPPMVTLEIFDSSTGVTAGIANFFSTATFRF
jgi:prepilin-type processing-associated H-X9-DG protein